MNRKTAEMIPERQAGPRRWRPCANCGAVASIPPGDGEEEMPHARKLERLVSGGIVVDYLAGQEDQRLWCTR